MIVRTRFAPSPTGYLHIGGARTALFAWLYARQQSGTFILRIEDTDQSRSTIESAQAIIEAMAWLGLTVDEGPIYQCQRLPKYQAVIEQLLKTGQAYYCDCSVERLNSLREEQLQRKQKPKYDGHCRNRRVATTAHSVVRFRNPESGSVAFKDEVFGDISIANTELDDLIIQRSDGLPTYNLAVAVDDWDMGITHVIRGSDHLNNTPRQIHLLKAMGAEPPVFAHVPMILNEQGKPLSKRRDAVSVLWYRDMGYLPQALCNFLVRLGWSDGDQEIFSLDSMIELFNLKGIHRNAACLDPQKLLWLNQYYLASLPDAVIVPQFEQALQRHQLVYDKNNKIALIDIVQVQKNRCKTIEDMVNQSRYLFTNSIIYDSKSAIDYLTSNTQSSLQRLLQALQALQPDQWQAERLQMLCKQIVKDFQLKFPQLAQPIRVALTGNTVSPAIHETIYLLGQKKTIQRLQNALDWIENNRVDMISQSNAG